MAASISELKINLMRMALSGDGEPIAILNRNEPAFYYIPAKAYKYLMDRIEDLELITLAEKRKSKESVKVN